MSVRRSRLALVLLLVAGLSAEAAGGPLVAAHRGGSLLWPENSLLAFRNALALPVDFLETDLHLTRDGEVVIVHDPTLDRTTTGRGPVGEATRADLAPVRIRAADGSVTAEPVPTLGGLLDLAGGARVHLLLEIKVDARGNRYPAIEEAVLGQVRARGLGERAVIMSFDRATLQRVRVLDVAVRTALLVAPGQVRRAGVGPVETIQWARAVGATDLGLEHHLIDAGVVDAAHRAGLRLAAWTVNEEADLRRMIDLGVDVVISDRPDVAARLAGR